MRNPKNCPTGVYILPEEDNLNGEDIVFQCIHMFNFNFITQIKVWHGVLFIHRGYFKEGIFKFQIHIPEEYPDEGPSVYFMTDMFHPLISTSNGAFSLKQQFPIWRPQKDFICHVLHYIKNSFKESSMLKLEGFLL